ncbi:MAG: hypothetical protein ABIF10_00350, partial [Candidatus Woesearchaeota archaeon]
IFIILGFVAMTFAAFLVYVKVSEDDNDMEIALQRTLSSNPDSSAISIHINECLNSAAASSIRRFQNQGGYFDLSNPLWYESRGSTKVAYGLKHTVNLIPTKEAAEIAIAQDIKDQMEGCTLPTFPDSIIEETGEKSVTMHLASDTATVNLDYPLKIRKGQKQITISDFETTVQANLAGVLQLASNIVNLAKSETSQLDLSTLDFSCSTAMVCIEENRFIKIIKYDEPSKIFQFAIEDDITPNSCSSMFRIQQGVCDA